VSEARTRLRIGLSVAADAIKSFAESAQGAGAGQRWKIRCFGPLRIYRQDETPVRWSAANGATIKTKTLFAYLLNCGAKGATAEDLADLLWPQAESINQSLNRLYHTIHCLRMTLSPNLKQSRASPYVLGHDHHYRLALPESTWIDVPVFEQFCRRGEKLLKADQLDDALACYVSAETLYTGCLLSDIPRSTPKASIGTGAGAAATGSERFTSRCSRR
jgi:two-component SAPR family response regulator